MFRNLLTIAVLATVQIAACAVQPSTPDAFWSNFEFGPAADEIDHFETLGEMRARSDAIVVATISSVSVGRVIQGDAPQDVVAMVEMNLVVGHVIEGTPPETLTIEFLGGAPRDANEIVFRARAAGLPGDPIVVFLHEKDGAEEAGLYRVGNSTGLWAATTRSALDTPLRPETPAASGLYADELRGRTSVDDLVELLTESR